MAEHLSHNWKPQLLLLYTLREVESVHDDRPAACPRRPETTADVEGGGARAGRGPRGPHARAMFAVADQLRHGSGLVIAAAIMEREAG